MIHPEFIDHTQRHDALNLAHDGRRELLLPLGIGALHERQNLLFRLLPRERGQLLVGEKPCARGEEDGLEMRHHLEEMLLVSQLRLLTEGAGDIRVHIEPHHGLDVLLQILAVEHLAALLVNDLTLDIHHVVVFQHVLSGLEVAALNGLLRVLDRAGENFGVDGRILVDAERLHHVHNALGAEQAHDIVLHGQIKPRLAGVALAAGTAAKLIVDPARFMTLGADDEKASCLPHKFCLFVCLDLEALIRFGIGRTGSQNFGILRLGEGIGLGDQFVGQALLAQFVLCHVFGVAAQHDVGAAARHVRRNGHGAQMARLRDDLGFFFMVLGVQDVVRDTLALEHLRQKFRFFNGDRADQNRLALGMAFLDLRDDGTVFACLGLINNIGVVDTDDRFIRRDLDNVEIVNAGEFLLLGQRCAGHAGKLVVQTEEVLECDGGERLVFACNLDALLGLDGLMQTLVITAAVHESAGEFIDDDDLAVLDNVVDITLHEAPCLHGLIDVVRERGVFWVGQIFYIEELLGLFNALLRERHGAVFFIDNVIAVILILQFLVVRRGEDLLFQAGDEIIRHFIQLGRFLAFAGNDERCARFVNEDGVNLINDGERVTALHHLLFVNRHIVAQIIEAQLVICAVGDIGGIGCAALFCSQIVDNEADGKS